MRLFRKQKNRYQPTFNTHSAIFQYINMNRYISGTSYKTIAFCIAIVYFCVKNDVSVHSGRWCWFVCLFLGFVNKQRYVCRTYIYVENRQTETPGENSSSSGPSFCSRLRYSCRKRKARRFRCNAANQPSSAGHTNVTPLPANID